MRGGREGVGRGGEGGEIRITIALIIDFLFNALLLGFLFNTVLMHVDFLFYNGLF